MQANEYQKWSEKTAIYPKNESPSWITFDVDTGDEAFEDTKKIVSTIIKYGINRKDILVTFSGNKGYHIEIFFKYPMQQKFIIKIYVLSYLRILIYSY